MSAFASLQPWFRPYADELYRVAQLYGGLPRITSTFRSVAEQRILRQQYERGTAQFYAARPGCSLHNYGLAFDLVTETEAFQQWLGQVWESWGGRWGGRFNDPVHFDSGHTIQGCDR